MQKNPFHQIPAPLLSWYRAHKRSLPWRENPTPYAVWVSEIMLQQTRVEAVKEYYARFMQALPNMQALATCEEEKLLKLWEGLGYYSRVRNMQKTARQVVAYYGGELPGSVDALKTLPGIGDYTAGAIASIAFKKRAAAVDGNVLRVLSRWTENATPINDTAYRRSLERQLVEAYPIEGEACAEFTQSLFELGALICKPQNPDCLACPLQSSCQAKRHQTQSLYPVMPEKRAKRIEDIFVFLIQTREGFCVRRRENGVLKGMNEFPSAVATEKNPSAVLNDWGIYDFEIVRQKAYTHIFTHIKWNITCVWIRTDFAPFDAYGLDEINEHISLPTAFKQCLGVLE